jgi:hypothetical protein
VLPPLPRRCPAHAATEGLGLRHQLDATHGQRSSDLVEYNLAHMSMAALRGDGDRPADLKPVQRAPRDAPLIPFRVGTENGIGQEFQEDKKQKNDVRP